MSIGWAIEFENRARVSAAEFWYTAIVTPTRLQALLRRLAAALALLAVLALGLHKSAHAAGSFAGDRPAPIPAEQSRMHAVSGLGKGDDGGVGKHHRAAPHSCHVCGTLMPLAGPTVAVPAQSVAAPVSAITAEHPGLDPGSPRRPPRLLVIA